MTKQHRHKLIPTTEAFGIALGLMPVDQLIKPAAVEQSNQLTE
jgi:hypothetical protein